MAPGEVPQAAVASLEVCKPHASGGVRRTSLRAERKQSHERRGLAGVVPDSEYIEGRAFVHRWQGKRDATTHWGRR